MAKTDPKTMRFDEDVAAYIEKQKGDNFSEKFHNMVRYFRDTESEKKRNIAALERTITQKSERLTDLTKMLNDMGELEAVVKNLRFAMGNCGKYVEKISKEYKVEQ